MADAPKTALASLDTGYLERVKREMMHFIPGDPTAFSHITNILRTLVAAELADPARIAADKKFAEEAAATAERLAKDAQEQSAANQSAQAQRSPQNVQADPVAPA